MPSMESAKSEVLTSEEIAPYSLARVKSLRLSGWLSITSITLETIIVIILQSIAFSLHSFEGSFDLQVYSGCFIWSFIYLAFYLIDAILQENIIQLYAFNILHLGYFGFSLYQVLKIPTTIFIANTVVLGAFVLIYPILTKDHFFEFGWRIYRKIGADPRIKAMFRNYQVFLVCLKSTFLLTMLFLVQQIFIILGFYNYETYLDLLVPPLYLLVWFGVVRAVKRENKPFMITFLILCFLANAYFIYKIFIFQFGAQYGLGGKYEFVGTIMLTQTAAYCLLCYFITLVVAIIAFINFGKGLAQKLGYRNENNQSQQELQPRRSMRQVE